MNAQKTGSSPPACDDHVPCTIDYCDPVSGACSKARACDDHDPCTIDYCDPATGDCSKGPVSCDDGNCCTIDGCDPATGCTHTANTAPPAFTVQPSLGSCPLLWPPQHGYVDFSIADTGASAASSCGIASIQFTSCSSSQPENAYGTGDGNSTRDCVYSGGALSLRAERDGACSPIGRVYTTRLVAVDVCGNATRSNALEVGVWHDRAHAPASGQVYHASSGSGQNDSRAGVNGTYGQGCGGGSSCVNGTTHDHSDADPEAEIEQGASISVGDLHVDKASGGNVRLTWTEPAHQPGINVTRFHIYRLDPVTFFWTQIAEVTKQTTSYLDPVLNDAAAHQYKIAAVIKQ